MDKLFYSTSEVADIFHVNRVTIYRWIKSGRIAACEIGKHYKIPGEEVSRMVRDFGISGGLFLDLCKRTERHRSLRPKDLPESRNDGQKLVFIVAGNPRMRERIVNAFKKGRLAGNCNVMTFSDGIAAALEIGRIEPDVLLLRGDDPDFDGMEFAFKIQSLFHGVSVVFMVENAEQYAHIHKDQLDELGAALINTSLSRTELANSISSCLAK